MAERFDTVLNEEDRPLDRSALADALRNFDAVLPTVSDRLPADVFTGGGLRTRILGNFGVGYNHIDAGAAKEAGIVVTNTPGVLTDCTADLAVSLLLAAARRTGEGERQVRAGAWEGWRPTHMIGTKVTGRRSASSASGASEKPWRSAAISASTWTSSSTTAPG